MSKIDHITLRSYREFLLIWLDEIHTMTTKIDTAQPERHFKDLMELQQEFHQALHMGEEGLEGFLERIEKLKQRVESQNMLDNSKSLADLVIATQDKMKDGIINEEQRQ